MIEIKKTAIVPYSPEQMFNLVSDIKNYPKYLPWCVATEIKTQNNNEAIGTIYIEYLKIKTQFTTKNIYTKFSKIDIYLIDGPFTAFSGYWSFLNLGNLGCKIEFVLKYEFKGFLLEKLIGPVFAYISKSIIDCFIKEASKQYT